MPLRKLSDGTPVNAPADMSEAEIRAAMSSAVAPQFPAGAPPGFVAAAPESSRAPNDVGNRDWSGGGGQSLGRRALNTLPTVGGIVGDFAGGALATPLDAFLGPAGTYAGGVSGAGLGGMTGEGARQLILRAMGHPQADPWGEMQRQGRAQAEGAAGGRFVGGAIHALGLPLMKAAYRGVPASIERDVIQNEGRLLQRNLTPEQAGLAQQALKERTPVGQRQYLPGAYKGPAGSAQVAGKIAKQGKVREAALGAATQAGQRNVITDITRGPAMQRLQAEVTNPALASADADGDALNKMTGKIVGQFTNATRGRPYSALTPNEINKLKMDWANEALRLFKSRPPGSPPTAGTLEERAYKALQQDAERLLESIPKHGKAIAQANARMSQLYPLKAGTAAAEEKLAHEGGLRLGLYDLLFGLGGGLGGYGVHGVPGAAIGGPAIDVLARVMQNRGVLSRLALGATSPAVKYGAPIAAHTLAGFGVPPQDIPAPPGRQPGPNAQGR